MGSKDPLIDCKKRFIKKMSSKGGGNVKINSSQSMVPHAVYKATMAKVTPEEHQLAKKDQVEISSDARKLNEEIAAAKEQRIQELKTQIENGTYELDPEKTAEAILRSWTKGGK
ncbi:flagellar biosynthesis anti-sigma factor FlgM [Shouchella clausii]|nr:flagellar biosynthesis anti-sigma factor FlgM [Shouchella clausii]PAE79289.1 flagellar biosynthesis anti-sigma factor FlgM [Shouchella clausii]